MKIRWWYVFLNGSLMAGFGLFGAWYAMTYHPQTTVTVIHQPAAYCGPPPESI